ncbi:unnamed protein product [Urochloa humidicola]
MAIPVARVHLATAHAALPGLLPAPPNCTMLPLLPSPPCATVLPTSSPPRPSRADAAERWDAHKTKQGGGSSAAPSPPSAGSSGRASSCAKWVINKKKNTGATSSSSSSSSADSEERWDANKKPAGRNKWRDGSSKRRATSSRASSSAAERWDAHKNGRRAPRADEFDGGESITGSNDTELDKVALPRAFYDGPGFIASPAPSMLPMPSFMIRVAA